MQVKDKNKDGLEILKRDFWAGRENIPGTWKFGFKDEFNFPVCF